MAEGPQAPIGHRCQIEDTCRPHERCTPLFRAQPNYAGSGSHFVRSRTSIPGAPPKGRGVRVPCGRRGVRRGGSGAPASAAPTGAPGRNEEGSDARDADSLRRGGAARSRADGIMELSPLALAGLLRSREGRVRAVGHGKREVWGWGRRRGLNLQRGPVLNGRAA